MGIGVWLANASHAADSAAEPVTALARAEQLLDEGRVADAASLLREAMDVPSDHYEAYGRLVRLAIDARDRETLSRLFADHSTFPFAVVSEFRRRVAFYDLWRLRRTYNLAIQAAMAKHWAQAEQGFAQLLGDGAFHDQAAAWLFRTAVERRDYDRARFLAELTRVPIDNPVGSADLLVACALQPQGERQPALGHLIRVVSGSHGYTGSGVRRGQAQRAIFLALLRLHNDLDQCFLGLVSGIPEARRIFPDLPDEILGYLRPGSVSQSVPDKGAEAGTISPYPMNNSS